MGMIKINDNPSTRELRQFAGIWFPLLWIVIAWFVYLGTRDAGVSAMVALVGMLVGAVGLAQPAFMHPIYLLWMYAVYPIGWTISHLVMLVIFYGLFMPAAFIMRIVGYDPMHRRLEARDTSNWVRIVPPKDKTEYFRQF